MNGNHLPAGQHMPGGVGGAPGPGSGRRRPPPQYSPHQQAYHPQQHVGHMYTNSYMNPYASSYYPGMPHPYQNGYMQHSSSPYTMQQHTPSYPARSPPAINQPYPPIVSSSMQQHPQPYSRPPPPQQQASPAMSTPPPYPSTAPPVPQPQPQSAQPAAAPVPQTPSSTQSSQVAPASLTPPTPQVPEVSAPHKEVDIPPVRAHFKAPLPWLSRPDLPFPTRTQKTRRRRRMLGVNVGTVELPTNQQAGVEPVHDDDIHSREEAANPDTPKLRAPAPDMNIPLPSGDAAAHGAHLGNAQPASSSSPASVHTAQTSTTALVSPKPSKSAARSTVPAVPVVPAMPKASPKDTKGMLVSEAKSVTEKRVESLEKPDEVAVPEPTTEAKAEPVTASTSAKQPPKLWSGLFQHKVASTQPATGTPNPGTAAAGSGDVAINDGSSVENVATATATFTKSNTNSLAEALRSYSVNDGQKIAFLEPRGLINTGNMCYMNSVLQVLIFCIPFYDFLDQVSKRAVHSFKSETPLLDAMIMFMREYKMIDSAITVEQLRRRLKSEELEQYGEAFTPEFVYDAIRKLPRFASMRRGHQQDAEEFLGFLLESLHEECVLVMRHVPELSPDTTANSATATPTAMSSPTSSADANDWLEVGRRQKAAVTRSSGHPITSSPLTKIFGGQLRSELRVRGKKDSVTLEPFQPLQLDIGSPQVHNIVDALKNLTRPETLHGDFNSPRGPEAVATKQVLIESLPPVLILHLKRFQFDAEGGTVKIWKKVGYPLELELPKEVFSRQKRNVFTAEGSGFPKYRLIAAVYHHGKNAGGGHYTVDLRRQEGREWIRLDDTVIRRIRSEDVAEGGAEEKSATTRNEKEVSISGSSNRFEGIGDEDAGDDEGWNKVSAPVNGTRKWSSVLNGDTNKPSQPPKGNQGKDNIKDNKVAYLLFYQKI